MLEQLRKVRGNPADDQLHARRAVRQILDQLGNRAAELARRSAVKLVKHDEQTRSGDIQETIAQTGRGERLRAERIGKGLPLLRLT